MYWPGRGASRGSCGYPFLFTMGQVIVNPMAVRDLEDLAVLVEYEWPPNCGVGSLDEKDVR